MKEFNLSDLLLTSEITNQSGAQSPDLCIPLATTQNAIGERVQFSSSLEEFYRKGIHGVEHAYRVLRLVQKISELENISAEQKLLLEFCAIFHDIGRINDYIDNSHGIRSIKKLEKYDYFGLYAFDNPYVKYIIENHCISDEIAFRNISKYDISNQPLAFSLISS